MTKKKIALRILSLLTMHVGETIFLAILAAVAITLDVVTVPIISQGLIDKLIEILKNGGNGSFQVLFLSSAAILLATVISSVLYATYDYRLFRLVTKIEDNIHFRTVKNYLRLHALFHHGTSSGQIIGRIERGSSAIYAILHDIFGQNLLKSIFILLGVFTALMFKDPLVALTVFLPLPIYIFSVRKISEKIFEIEKQVNEEFETVSKESYDVAANVMTVKKFHQEEAETQNQIKLQEKARATQYGAERLWKIMENIQTLITTLGRISVILFGGFLVLKGRSSIGEFVLYITLQNMAYTPLYQLSIILPRLRRSSARAERLFAVLDEPILVKDRPDAIALAPHSQSIAFRDVWFSYGKTGKWALKNINIKVPYGKTVALVGRSGSGKTTFINLLLRSFDPDRGAILIDGIDLRGIKRESLLSQIAVVPQEVDLFSRTIYQNISYGKPVVSREMIERAAQIAMAHDFIMSSEKGYETVVGDRGIKLSGGERQRVGIARAILRDPRILILDEATSHLDTESEKLIAQATNALIKDRTTFIIAHRLSTILDADMILVFKNGEIEAWGRHEELLEKSSTYQKLYSLQFRE